MAVRNRNSVQFVVSICMAVPETRQVTIGGKKKPEEQKAVEAGEAPTVTEEYKEAYKSLKKAVALLPPPWTRSAC